MAATAKGTRRETGIQVIARASEILRLLAKSEHGTTLRSLSDDTGLPRSTVHRIVVALAAENLAVWDPERGVAELGLGLISLALSRRQRLRDAVRPYLEALVRKVDETVDLVTLRGETVLFVDQVMAHQLLVISAIGAMLPVHCTACGKALLAALPPRRRGAHPPEDTQGVHASHDHRPHPAARTARAGALQPPSFRPRRAHSGRVGRRRGHPQRVGRGRRDNYPSADFAVRGTRGGARPGAPRHLRPARRRVDARLNEPVRTSKERDAR